MTVGTHTRARRWFTTQLPGLPVCEEWALNLWIALYTI